VGGAVARLAWEQGEPMGALTIGPLVLSLDRAFAALGFMVLLLGAEWLARRGRSELSGWAWSAAAVTFLGARATFVAANLDDYLRDPASIVAIWQGGFAPLGGLAVGAAYTVWRARRSPVVRARAPILAALALAAWLVPAALFTPAVGSLDVRVPAVTLPTLDGTPVSLGDGGVPSIVNVWATWCPPCRRELPLLIATAAATPDVRVLLVNQGEGADTVASYLEREGLAADGVLLDRRGAVGAALRVAGLPTTMSFDADGRLVGVHVGELSAPALRRLVAGVR
jgi:cytochrome c biogenesis protein CcmG, thiol:disulfide interchange protein DsbE